MAHSTDPMSRTGIAIMAKAPIPGLAKTRLIPHLGAEGAAALQRWLLQRTVTAALVADVGPVTLWCAPDTRHPDFSVCRAFGAVRLEAQPNGDLGERMHTALQCSPTPAGTLIIGTDCPVLTPQVLQQAAGQLQAQGDAIVIPAEDGGYVLVGMRQVSYLPFDRIDWGSARVMAQTRERLRDLQWQWTELDPLWDVDLKADYERLCAQFPEAGAAMPSVVGT
ncbi:MAG: TIGR04282 family arsenosugar biosynthesis glycosyltransferase [Betaproteobacteria bacterium]|nr:TIGR04282 family arsenosugar biosynthesis glycosyltransferase [Betaproteobacteria bacterium]